MERAAGDLAEMAAAACAAALTCGCCSSTTAGAIDVKLAREVEEGAVCRGAALASRRDSLTTAIGVGKVPVACEEATAVGATAEAAAAAVDTARGLFTTQVLNDNHNPNKH